MQALVGQPGVSQGLCCTHPPALALHQQTGDEVLGFTRDVFKLLLLKVPLTGQDVVQGLVVIVAKKWRQAAESRSRGKHKLGVLLQPACLPTACLPACNSQHVGDDTEAPHVCGE